MVFRYMNPPDSLKRQEAQGSSFVWQKSVEFCDGRRVINHFFQLRDEADPAFLIIPENLHEAARDFFGTAEREQLGPNYECPFIDPYWGLEKIKGILKP